MIEQNDHLFLNQALQLADIMRGAGLTSLDYVEQIGYLLYLKVLNDIYPVTEHSESTTEYWRLSQWERIAPADLPRYIGQDVYPRLALRGIGQKEVDQGVRAIFNGAYLLVRDPAALQDVLAVLNKIELGLRSREKVYNESSRLLLGDVFERLLTQLFSENAQFSRFYTPRYLVDLMVQMIMPQLTEDIYDPAFGTGGMFIGTVRHLFQKMHLDKYVDDRNIDLDRINIYGHEIDFRTYKLGLMNVVFNGLNPQGLHLVDSLSREAQNDPKNSYDIILTNMLFESGTIPVTGRAEFPVPTRDFAALFLQHVVERLGSKGRAVVVVPEGLLFHSGAEQDVRKYLLNHVRLDVVLSLPHGVFAPYTSGKSSILLFQSIGPTKEVLFCQASPLDIERIATNNDLTHTFIKTESEVWKNLRSTMDSRLVRIEEIINTDYILTTNRYLAQQKNPSYPIIQLGDVLDSSTRGSQLQPESDQLYQRLSVNVDQNGVTLRESVSGVSLQSVVSKFYMVYQGQVLVDPRHVLSSSLGVVPKELDRGIVREGYYIYNIKSPKVRPEFLDYCLRYEEVIGPLKHYISRGNINRDALLKMSLPLPPIDVQDEYIERLRLQHQLLRQSIRMRTALEAANRLVETSLFSPYPTKSLGSLGELQSGIAIKGQPSHEGIPLIRVRNLEKERIDYSELTYISPNEIPTDKRKSSQYLLKPGDLLFTRVHGSRNKVGLCVMFDSNDQYFFSSNIIRVRLNTDLASAEYIALYMNSIAGRREIEARSKGSLQLSIRMEDIRSILVPLPSKPEQFQILSRVQEQRKLYHQIIEDLIVLERNSRRFMDSILAELY